MPFDKETSLKAFHGTTTVGFITKDATILAADKRATAGTLIASRTVKKIVKITDYAAMTIAGLVADAQMLADAIREEARLYETTNKRKLTVKSMATLLANVLFSTKYYPYLVQLIIGGYDTEPRLYNLDYFGSITEEKMTSTGSGSPVALGVLEREYRQDMSLEEAINLAAKAVKVAIMRDSATGDGVDVIAITSSGIRESFISLQQLLS
ncbi:MAG: archaeal proteasome endopeptidase complex subunit beta [Caldisphaera sp.]|jgi:proteasome beta subunit|nr:archaeal proteasome endopeptidase complex subunit beta [Caldisphaera sp.]